VGVFLFLTKVYSYHNNANHCAGESYRMHNMNLNNICSGVFLYTIFQMLHYICGTLMPFSIVVPLPFYEFPTQLPRLLCWWQDSIGKVHSIQPSRLDLQLNIGYGTGNATSFIGYISILEENVHWNCGNFYGTTNNNSRNTPNNCGCLNN